MAICLSLEDATFAFDKFLPVLEKVRLEIEAGECFGVFGPAGGGKTTLMKVLAGILRLQSGHRRCHVSKISMAFQRGALFDSLTVFENLAFPLRELKIVPRTQIHERVYASLVEVGLEGCEKKMAVELSGGQQKRLALSRAFITEPDLLLLDDPAAGLDPVTSREMIDLIRRIRKKSLSIVVASSDPVQVLEVSDRVGMFHKGNFVKIGRPSEINSSSQVLDFLRGSPESTND